MLTEDQYQLANMILFHMRMSRLGNDEMVVFSTAVNELYVCDRDKKILCKGRIEGGYFTGYKSTYEYEGEYVAGKRHGKGIEYCMSIYDVDSHFLVREGIWENDQFIEGSMRNVPKG